MSEINRLIVLNANADWGFLDDCPELVGAINQAFAILYNGLSNVCEHFAIELEKWAHSRTVFLVVKVAYAGHSDLRKLLRMLPSRQDRLNGDLDGWFLFAGLLRHEFKEVWL